MWLVVHHPFQFGSGEIAGGVEQVGEAFFISDFPKCPLPCFDRPAVAPDDGGAQQGLVFIHQNQSVHLVGNADGLDVLRPDARLCQQFFGSEANMLPPHFRVLLCPSLLRGTDRHFCFWGLHDSHNGTGRGFNDGRFDRRASDVVA